ncbi:MAG TPA: cellulose binding domain-containing protein, partial [Polyangiaceae bacterium]|nr:cellulose binding domain-containing protein [Polyangiaceae bacterium]
LEPSAFVGCGETQRLCATLSDSDGDPLEFSWTSELTPLVVERVVDGDSVSECVELVAEQAGDYEVALTVFDLGLLDGAWTRIEEILASQQEAQPSRYETPLAFRAECSARLSAALSYSEATQQGYCADVEVVNTGAAAAESWSVVVRLLDSKLVAGSEVGAIFSASGSLLTASSPSGSDPLSPGESTSFRFCAKKAGPHPAAEVTSVSAP